MKKHFALLTLLLSALCLGFTSCGGDDDSTTSGNDNTSGTTTETRQLSKVQLIHSDEENLYTSTVLNNATYQNGRITYSAFTIVDEDGSHPGTCTIGSTGNDKLGFSITSNGHSEILYGSLNSLGFITSISQLGSYQYNNDGQVTKLTDNIDDCTLEFTYSNGDLTRLVAKDLDTNTVYVEAEFTYEGALENKGNLSFYFMYMSSLENMFLNLYGYLGNSTKHLPTAISGQHLTWTFDKQGYPTSVKSSDGTGATFAWR